jgi:predicted porin
MPHGSFFQTRLKGTPVKRTALALALFASTGAAFAQSSVTLYGIMDSMYSAGSGSSSNKSALGSGGNMTSRFGFRGLEDLGGGLKAGFNLESQVFVDSGAGQPTNTNNQTTGLGTENALTFARRSTVSLMDGWGELRLGRDFTAHYRNRVEVDPFGNAGVGAIQPFSGSIGGPVSTRASNMIGYFIPVQAQGVYGQAQYYLGEGASNTAQSKDGTGLSARLGFVVGTLNLSLATAKTTYATTATAGDIASTNLGVQYGLGDFKLMTGWYRDRVNSTKVVTANGWTLGGILTKGPGNYKIALSKYGTDATGSPITRKLSLGYVHNLSARTALYATVAKVENKGGATTSLNGSTTGANSGSSGWDMGIRHTF